VVAHAKVVEEMPVESAQVFDLLHDYDRRLEWDTLLRAARLEGGGSAGVGRIAVCTARRALGGFSFRTRYVSFDRPRLAALTLVAHAPFFHRWAASIRHEDLPGGGSTAAYTLTFTCRPAWAAGVIEPVAQAVFTWETKRRLRALARVLGGRSQPR